MTIFVRMACAAAMLAVVPAGVSAQLVDNRLKAIDSIQKMNAAFAAASVLVLGRDPKPSESSQWIAMMATPEYGMSEQVSQGITFLDAAKFLKMLIARPAGAALRAEAIDNACQEVYGRPSTAVEQASWDAQVKASKAWFASIVVMESAKLNASPAERTAMIARAYQRAEGRAPYAGDAQFWGPKGEHFREIVTAERAWLYTDKGATELVAVAGRAWQAKYGMPATDANTKAMLIKATPTRMIFAEMVAGSNAIKIAP
jgi:hypothetical protein